ncbi:Lrp/AsnC family transcriptional regulator [Alkalicoccus urumqiensis]|uniref:AsnC family transcriptional regulator n=1 Tax=Alkalicoccus urumqiensis TaxID=1548213 RepID=A0A2P6ME46_ALKUR|nr:Lrp/AsnC family transcriptional regulator [Alkalicoccus urumqiensis]PRO64544.1 AsnC family transcriptional regulator [Alkalicoccus urumqiensis]
MDHMDLHILDILQHDARLSNQEIARRVSLSPPATHSRIRRLEEDGVIERYTALLNEEALGFDLLCFIFMSTNIHQTDELQFLEGKLKERPEVLECYCLTGEYDYLLKIVVSNRKELETFVRRLNELGGARIQTSLTLREVKNSTMLPLDREKA